MADVDVILAIAHFARELRAAGLAVSQGQLEAFLRSFEWLSPLSQADVYHAARTTLLTRREDVVLFERLFARFWLGRDEAQGPAKMPLAPRHRRSEQSPALAMLLSERARSSDPEIEVRDRSYTANDDEVLRRKDFALMTARELEALRRQFQLQRWDFATRVTR
ncbi:MAG TPA: hypothetical protein VMG12_15765, partial [Polyangiaceae bacterium]|nr:hypothetical protein [Polyangiaceae bacterium]